MYCVSCGKEVAPEGKYCVYCGAERLKVTASNLLPPTEPEMKFCMDCGQKILLKAEFCPKCGSRQIAAAQRPLPQNKMTSMGIGLSTMGLIAAVAIVGFWIVSWIIDALTTAVDEHGVAPVFKFLLVCAVGIRGFIRSVRHS